MMYVSQGGNLLPKIFTFSGQIPLLEPFKQKFSNSTFILVLWYALHVKIFDTIEMFDFFLLLSLVALQNGIFNPDMT